MRKRAIGLWWVALIVATTLTPAPAAEAKSETPKPRRVTILPIRADIMPPLVYVVRRGVKEAMDNKSDLLLLDMETNGGRVDSTEEIITILSQFKGRTVTYVNTKAYSAGAFISVATQEIYMAPESVIGAALVISAAPGGAGAEQLPDTLEIKATSAISARIRSYAEKNGHNPAVVQAMIDKKSELVIDGVTINEKGNVLTLNNREAERMYGNPPKPLLSAGTVESLDALLAKLGFAGAEVKRIEPSGAEKLATWINALNWLWLIIGVAGIYLEFKTPGFGLPGIVGICAFAFYFLGSYVAGLSGMEWPALFILGLLLVIAELFIFPGTVVLGLAGAMLMLFTIVMAMVDMYPGMPALPTLPQLKMPLRDLGYALVGSIVVVAALARLLPKTPIYATLVTQSVSGGESVAIQEKSSASHLGREGVALSILRPSGRAQFGDEVLDVITQGDLIEKGARVRIIAYSGREAIVEAVAS